MTTFPRQQSARPAAAIAKSTREATRAHARLDNVESVQSKQTSDITTANTNIALNTTAIAAINTRLGSADMAFLSTLGQMSHQSSASTSGIGTISGTPTDTEYNATNTALNALVNSYNTLLSHLQAQGYMS